MSEKKSPARLPRRAFLKGAAAASVGPVLLPASVFARPAPSDTLRMGCIGVGRQGQGDMQELIYRGLEVGARVVAVCDVDVHRREDAQWLAKKIYAAELGTDRITVDAYADFRDLLARADIDGVLIVTPDHWHAVQGIAAAEAGKDIYLEKPLTYTIAEGQALVKAVRANKRVMQVGSQQRSSIYFRLAAEAALNKRIGKLKAIRTWLPTDSGEGDPRPAPVPANLDYEFWLGPRPEAPFCEDRVHPQRSYDRPGWLQIEDYSRGMITGWGSHMIDSAQWGHGTDLTGPVEISAKGEFPDRGLFNVHTNFAAEARFADGITLYMESGNAGVRFEGETGWVFADREQINASDPAILRQPAGPNDIKLYVSSNHMKDFLGRMRDRKDPIAPVEVGHRSNSICVLVHIAMKLGRKLRWDPAAERFVGDPEADGWLDYSYRAPWKIPG